MCQLSLPAELLLTPQSLVQKTIEDTNPYTPRKPAPKIKFYKMQYTSTIILGFLNAFAIATPINYIRSPLPPSASAAIDAIPGEVAGGVSATEAGIATAESAIDTYTKRQIPASAEAAVANAIGAIPGEVAGGVSAAEAGIATAESAIDTYTKRQIPASAEAAVANAIGAIPGEAEAGVTAAEAAIAANTRAKRQIPDSAEAAIKNAEATVEGAVGAIPGEVGGGISAAEAGIATAEAAIAANTR